MGIDLGVVKGTGKHGRIHKEDLINFKENPSKATAPVASSAEKPK